MFKASHPFSGIMTTLFSIIITSKVTKNFEVIVIVGSLILLSQLIVGISNDFLDLETDRLYQPDKPLVNTTISSTQIKIALGILGGGFITLGFLYTTAIGAVVLTIGILSGLSYNLGFKRTIYSPGSYFLAFGMLFLLPFTFVKPELIFSASPVFMISGFILIFQGHILNSIIDIDTDKITRNFNFVVQLGERNSVFIVIIGMLVQIILNIDTLPVALIFLIMLISLMMVYRNSKSYQKYYYGFVVLGLIAISQIKLFTPPTGISSFW